MFILALAMLAAPASTMQESLDWLVGHWCTEPEQGKQTCERWSPMAKGGMQGQGEERIGGKPKPAEKMRITSDGGTLVFHAEPPGQAPADFRAGPPGISRTAIAFENREHDYPQRVRYWRQGEFLMAEISLADGSKPMRWKYHRVAD